MTWLTTSSSVTSGFTLAANSDLKKRRCRQRKKLAVFARELRVARKHFGIHDMAENIVQRHVGFHLGGDFVFKFFEIERLQRRTGATAQRFAVAKNDVLQFLRPAAQRLTESAREHVNHRLRKRRAVGFEIQNIGGVDAARGKKQRLEE